ncbi:hypothetical protein WFJ45_24265, partial [Salmonella enterica subsp. enterica serovar Minnesota]|uniref:hypothetical protein n=1 Tax=Salmonella enterica TaxID=28901 RepID=UPI003D29D483
YDLIGDALGLMDVPLGGVTLFDSRRVTGTTTTLSTSFEMTVLDGQTFEQLASRQVSYPIESDTGHPQISLVVESSMWAD